MPLRRFWVRDTSTSRKWKRLLDCFYFSSFCIWCVMCNNDDVGTERNRDMRYMRKRIQNLSRISCTYGLTDWMHTIILIWYCYSRLVCSRMLCQHLMEWHFVSALNFGFAVAAGVFIVIVAVRSISIKPQSSCVHGLSMHSHKNEYIVSRRIRLGNCSIFD